VRLFVHYRCDNFSRKYPGQYTEFSLKFPKSLAHHGHGANLNLFNSMQKKIKRALISVSDKSGVIEFARALQGFGVELLSTGGTARELIDNGIAVSGVSDVTGFPEIMDGRVKTLHPKIHGAILARREVDAAVMDSHGIVGIDLVVVNLYPFQQTISQLDCTFENAIENIDIGGPAMIRAAAKNHTDVTVVTDPSDYALLLSEFEAGAETSLQTRTTLAQKAFAHTAQYDYTIQQYLLAHSKGESKNTENGNTEASHGQPELLLHFQKQQDLRYGENPHQTAAFYKEPVDAPQTIASAVQRQGKELSFNNIADADAALECVKQFSGNACVIVKHANPCGVAEADSIEQAYDLAYRTDPVSAFGGIIAFNRELTKEVAEFIVERQFAEVIVAPRVADAALQVMSKKPNIRVLECGGSDTLTLSSRPRSDYRRVTGGLLVQDSDLHIVRLEDLKTVSKVQPVESQLTDLLFAWKVVKFVKSNAIVFCDNRSSIGIGAGQMSRVYSAKIAAIKAQDAELSVAGTVMASDAFFPFRDTIDQAAELGVSAIIQPGGSMRDDEVIQAANEHGIAMVFTGVRHFRH